MILGPSFFIDLIDGDDEAVERTRMLEINGVIQRVPAQVVYELYVGVGYTETPDEAARRLEGVSLRPTTEPRGRSLGPHD